MYISIDTLVSILAHNIDATSLSKEKKKKKEEEEEGPANSRNKNHLLRHLNILDL
jgi:hypothetical protein